MADQVSVKLARIGQISINVHDLQTAVPFYRDALGIKFLFDAGKMAFFDCDGIRLMLALPEKPEFDHPSSIIYFRVEDIQGHFEVLTSRGVKFVGDPHFVARMPSYDLWMAFFEDLDRNTLSIYSEIPRPPG